MMMMIQIINFKIPMFLKDISGFFRNPDILKLAEFNINLKIILFFEEVCIAMLTSLLLMLREP